MNKKKRDSVLSDDEIILSVKEGNVQNFEIIVNRYKKRIINFVYKMILDPDEAQNISQDVFLKIFSNINKYREKDNFQSFIYTIAKNMTLNYIKKRSRITFFSGLPGTMGGENYILINGKQADEIEKREKDKLITDSLRTLRENQRLAIVMKVYLGLSYNRIKEITGWSIPKIETLISRAKQNLKKQVKLQEKEKNNV